MTDKEKAFMRFVDNGQTVLTFVPPCSVCKNCDGYYCKKMSGKRPSKYYSKSDPHFQKCPYFEFDPKAHDAEAYKRLSKDYKW